VTLELPGRLVIFDCGTGLGGVARDLRSGGLNYGKIDILISHLHLDHIIGLPYFAPLFDPDAGGEVRVFAESRGEQPLKQQVLGVFQPPFWPVDLSAAATARFIRIAAGTAFYLDEKVKITPARAAHPDTTTMFRLDCGGKSLVYALDYEAEGGNFAPLAEFCARADLVLFDSAYMPADYEAVRGYGHSTHEMGEKLALAANCGKVILSHIQYGYEGGAGARADTVLSERCVWAYDGLEVTL
jgi:ribonuclease BN (tRNA processing enzyme)